MLEDFTFNFGWMAVGAVITAAGGAIVFFYRPIAENLANGVSSYDRVKLFGIITVVVGFLVMSNLASFLLTWIAGLIFNR